MSGGTYNSVGHIVRDVFVDYGFSQSTGLAIEVFNKRYRQKRIV